VALVLINVGIALLIVAAIGIEALGPAWIGAAVLVAGVVAAAGAIMLWRRYLQARVEH